MSAHTIRVHNRCSSGGAVARGDSRHGFGCSHARSVMARNAQGSATHGSHGRNSAGLAIRPRRQAPIPRRATAIQKPRPLHVRGRGSQNRKPPTRPSAATIIAASSHGRTIGSCISKEPRDPRPAAAVLCKDVVDASEQRSVCRSLLHKHPPHPAVGARLAVVDEHLVPAAAELERAVVDRWA